MSCLLLVLFLPSDPFSITETETSLPRSTQNLSRFFSPPFLLFLFTSSSSSPCNLHISHFKLLSRVFSMEETKKVPLNPKAPEFYPNFGAKKISPPCPAKPKYLYPPPPRPVFCFNDRFRCYQSYKKPAKTFNAKPEKPRQPYHLLLCNRKCLPPRLLKQKVWVYKNRNSSPANTVPPPPPEEVKIEPLFGDKTSLMIRNIPNNFGLDTFLFKIRNFFFFFSSLLEMSHVFLLSFFSCEDEANFWGF